MIKPFDASPATDRFVSQLGSDGLLDAEDESIDDEVMEVEDEPVEPAQEAAREAMEPAQAPVVALPGDIQAQPIRAYYDALPPDPVMTAEIEKLKAENRMLSAENQTLSAEIDELKAVRCAKNGLLVDKDKQIATYKAGLAAFLQL